MACSRSSFIRVAVLGIFLWLRPGAAYAQDGAAEALFRAGRDALAEGDVETARRRFEESERLEPAPGTELNLALCEEKLGHLARAWQHFQQVMHALPSTDERARMARAHARALEPRLAWLTLTGDARFPKSASVSIGSTRYTSASFGVALPFDPGTYSLEVKAKGHAHRRYDVRLAAGDRQNLHVVPGVPLEFGRPGGDTTRAVTGALGLACAGASAAALLASVGSGILSLNEKSIMDRECDTSGCSSAGLNAASRGDAFATVSTTTFVGSLVLGVISTALLWGGSAEARPDAQRNASKQARAGVARPERKVTE